MTSPTPCCSNGCQTIGQNPCAHPCHTPPSSWSDEFDEKFPRLATVHKTAHATGDETEIYGMPAEVLVKQFIRERFLHKETLRKEVGDIRGKLSHSNDCDFSYNTASLGCWEYCQARKVSETLDQLLKLID